MQPSLLSLLESYGEAQQWSITFSLTNVEHVNPPCRRSCQVPPDMSVAQQTIYTPNSLEIPPFPLHCNVDSRGQLERCL